MKKLYYILLALCPAVFYLMTWVVRDYYTSSFVIARESERPLQREPALRVNTADRPDWSMTRTESAVDEYGYEPIVKSDAFIVSLFDMPVQTSDDLYAGTCYAYYQNDIRHFPCGICPPQQMKPLADSLALDIRWLTPDETMVIREIRRNITVDMNYETRHVTITYRAPDPMVATMMAQHICSELAAFTARYEQQKMQKMLDQMDCDEVQPMVHPAFMVLANPTIDYHKAGPHRSLFAMAMSLLVWGAVWAWRERKRILNYLA